jgi:cobalt/nickel transport system permease protein
MRVRLSPPPCVDSLLGRLDPRWRLGGLLVLMVVTAVVRTLAGCSLALAGALVLAILGRLPWRWARGHLLTSGFLLLLFALPLFFVQPSPITNLQSPLLVLGKGLALIVLALVLLTSGPLEVSLKAAHSLKVPGLLVQLVLMSYRYLFLLADELTRLRVAVRTRGFRNRANWHSYRTVGNLAGTLLVRGSERAERVAQAMRCRGFDGRFRSLAAFRTSTRDVLALVLLLGFAAGVLWVDGLI